jgi:hypothetical protein
LSSHAVLPGREKSIINDNEDIAVVLLVAMETIQDNTCFAIG